MQAGLGGDQLFGLRGQLGEVGRERGVVYACVCEGLTCTNARSNFAGELPIDSGRHVLPNYCRFFG